MLVVAGSRMRHWWIGNRRRVTLVFVVGRVSIRSNCRVAVVRFIAWVFLVVSWGVGIRGQVKCDRLGSLVLVSV